MTRQGKPTLQDLKAALIQTVTLVTSERLEGLRKAAEWYQLMHPFVLNMDRVSAKWYDRGESAYTLGRGGKTEGEQESGYLGAIRFFERALEGTNIRFYTIKAYEVKREQQRAQMQAELDKARKRYAPVLDLLEEAFAGFQAKFSVDPQRETGRTLSDNGDIVYGVETLTVMVERVRRGEGASVVLEELPTVVKANALQKDALGSVSVSAAVVLSTLDRAVDTLKAFFVIPVGEDSGEVKKRVRAVKPRKAKRSRKRPVTHYRTGSIMERILSRLRKMKSSETTVEDLFNGIKAADPDRFLRIMVRDGEESGKWTLRKERGGRITFRLH